eukprot:jgi/Orpsp1_1/1175388/evm.model.c7180000053657.1
MDHENLSINNNNNNNNCNDNTNNDNNNKTSNKDNEPSNLIIDNNINLTTNNKHNIDSNGNKNENIKSYNKYNNTNKRKQNDTDINSLDNNTYKKQKYNYELNNTNKRKLYNTNTYDFENVHKKQKLREPSNFDDIQNLDDKNEWMKSVSEELQNMETLQVFEPIEEEEIPTNGNITASRWIFNYKKDSNGNVIKRKARLVAKGYTQHKGVDYNETFSPTLKPDSIRIFTAIAVLYKFEIHQLDKAIYELKQSGRQWNEELNKFLTKIGYRRT